MSRPDSYLDRPLYRWPDRVYRLMLLTASLLLTTWPAMLGLLLLTPDIRNSLLYAVAAVPAGPGLAAGLYAARKLADGNDASTWSMFWKGYRQSWLEAQKVWLPVVVVATIVAVDLAWLEGQQSTWAPMVATMLPMLAILLSPFVVNALVIVSWFSFRTRDAARLSGYYTFMKPLATVGLLLVMGAVVAVVVAVSDWAAFMVAGLASYAVVLVTAPTVDHASSHFVRDQTGSTGDTDDIDGGADGADEEER